MRPTYIKFRSRRRFCWRGCDWVAWVPKQACTQTTLVTPSVAAALTDRIRWAASRLCTKFAGAALRASVFLMFDDQPSATLYLTRTPASFISTSEVLDS